MSPRQTASCLQLYKSSNAECFTSDALPCRRVEMLKWALRRLIHSDSELVCWEKRGCLRLFAIMYGNRSRRCAWLSRKVNLSNDSLNDFLISKIDCSTHGKSDPISIVTIALADLPTERYKRNVIRGKLDLVVSMGGTAGLFIGASLLSFVEIIYYFIVRPCYRFRNKSARHSN